MPTFEFTSPEGKTYEVAGPDGATKEQAFAILQQKIGGQTKAAPSPAPEQDYSTAGDIAKSLGIGGVEGGIGLLGLPGDIAELGTKGINWLTGSNLQNRVPLPTSAGIQKAVEGVTGEFYKPKGVAGEYARTAGAFLPAMIGGPETLATKALTRVALPAAASETAGQATKGTEAEPYARFAGGVGGAMAGAKASAKLGAIGAPKAPTLEEHAAAADYKAPAITEAQFTKPGVESIVSAAKSDLRSKEFRFTDKEGSAPKTFAALEDLREPAAATEPLSIKKFDVPVKASEAIEGGRMAEPHTYADFQATIKKLSNIAGNFSDQNSVDRAAASRALTFLKQYLGNVPQSHLLQGNAEAFSKALSTARAEYAVNKSIEKVQDRLYAAKLQAASANSGQNTQNAQRQKLRPLATTQKGRRGLTDVEQEAVENGVLGHPAANLLRTTGNYIKGPTGVAAALGGFIATGNPFVLAAPLAGAALKKASNAINQRQVDKIIETIKQRSPLYQDYLASLPPGTPKAEIARRVILAGLLSRQPQSPQGVLPLSINQ